MDTNDMLARAAQLSDHALLAQVQDLAQREREATAALIVHLAELDERRLYLAEGYSSLFKYCTEVLHLAEHATYNRIEAARAMRRFPVLLEYLAAGWVTLSAVRLLAPHLTPENCRDVLARAHHKSKREIEELVARLRPQPPVPDVVRKLPVRTQATSTAALPAGTQDPQSTPRDYDAAEIVFAAASSAIPIPVMPPAPTARRSATRSSSRRARTYARSGARHRRSCGIRSQTVTSSRSSIGRWTPCLRASASRSTRPRHDHARIKGRSPRPWLIVSQTHGTFRRR